MFEKYLNIYTTLELSTKRDVLHDLLINLVLYTKVLKKTIVVVYIVLQYMVIPFLMIITDVFDAFANKTIEQNIDYLFICDTATCSF